MVARSGARGMPGAHHGSRVEGRGGQESEAARMFLGEHQHSLDTKGRVILPARHRDQLEGGAVVTFQVDGCLAVYAPAAFEGMAAEVNASKRNQRGRDVARAFFANALNV